MKLPSLPRRRGRRAARPRTYREIARLWAWRTFALASVCVVAAGSLAIGSRINLFIRYSDFFALENIEVAGATPKLTAQVRDVVLSLRDRGENNVLFFDTERALFQIRNLPRVKRARAEKKFPDTLTIIVVERIPTAAANFDGLYWIDEEGILIDRAPATEIAARGMPIVTGLTGPRAYPGLQVKQGRLVDVLETVRVLNEGAPRSALHFSEWHLSGQSEIVGILDPGVEVRFGNRHPLGRMAVLEAALRELPDLDRIRYVDLRFDSQVVYL